MAFQSEIELRVKVIDKELRDLEKRAEKIQNTNPFSASGARSGQTAQQNRVAQAALRTDQKRLQLQQQINVGRIRELNDTAKLNRLFKDAAVVRASYAKDAERAAAATAKEALAAQKVAAANKKARNQKIGSAISGAAISAAFPILTGGGATESVLGGVGGLLGSALGPLGSFAGGIGGSALGRIIQDAEDLNLSLAELNGIIGDVGGTTDITASQIAELAKQLGIAKDETVDAVAAFSNLNPAEALEATKAFADVGGASTLEALAAAGIDRQSALQSIISLEKVISSELAEQLIEDLKINDAAIVQAALIAAVADEQETVNDKTRKVVGFWENIKSLVLEVGAALGGYDVTAVPSALDLSIEGGRKDANRDVVDNIIKNIQRLREATRNAQEEFKPEKTKTGRALPQSKELQLRAQILKTEISISDIQAKRAALQLTDLGAVRAKERTLADSLVKQTQVLELERQQALLTSKVPGDEALINELYDNRLRKIQEQNFFLREQNGLKEKDILLQRELLDLRNEQKTEKVVRGLTRDIENASSFGSSEVLDLRIKQLRRQEDLIGNITDKIKEQELIANGADAKKAEAAKRQIANLENEKAKIEGLLPVLEQAEQAQLRYNQAFAAINPAVNSLVSGLQEVVAGTKTAEEAFADFLRTIADQLVQTAATMIAQYIALGIARMFAFGGTPSSGFNLSGGGSSTGSGGLPGIDSLGGLFNGSLPFVGSGIDSFLADGGTATGGQPYIVGEKGPELFIPGVTGTVTNNDQFEAARDAMGGRSEGSSDAFNENADAIAVSNSYTRERTLERESQTREGSASSMVIETQVINNVEYATVEQVQIASAASAKQARAQVFSDMKNKPTIRRQVGVR